MSTVKTPISQLSPASPVFLHLIQFYSHGWDFILKQKDQSWTTVSKFFLKPRNFEQYWHDPNLTLGVRFGDRTKFGCIDLDRHSKYHPKANPKKYRRLLKALRKMGIRQTILIQSSDSGGVHLFFFLDEDVSTFDLACGLKRVLVQAGFEFKLGQLEAFPNTKRHVKKGQSMSLYNGLRVPLQPETGAKILDPKTFEPVSDDIKVFAKRMLRGSKKQNMKLLKQELATAREWYCNYKQSSGWTSGNQWEKDIETRLAAGFTAHGQTNELLKDLANLGRVFRGKESEADLAQFIASSVVELPGYKDYCGHQAEIVKRSWDWAKSSISFWSRWKSHPEERSQSYVQLCQRMNDLSGEEPEVSRKVFRGKWSRVNQKRHDTTLAKLRKILDLHSLASMPAKVLERLEFINEICLKLFGTKFSRNTLSKPEYLSLWHPKYVEKKINLAPLKSPVPCLAKARLAGDRWSKINNLLWSSCLSKISSYVVAAIDCQITKEKKTTETLLSKTPAQKSDQKTITRNVYSSSEQNFNWTAETALNSGIQKNDRTLMKRLCGSTSSPYLVYRVFVLNLELELSKLEIVQQLQSLLLTRFKTSETKLEEIRKAKTRNRYFYHGARLSVFNTSFCRQPKQVNELDPGTRVRILTDIHSSSLADDSRQIMVYVRPIRSEVKEKYLVPLSSLIQIRTKSDSYVKAVLPQIKGLVAALSFTKEDYSQYLLQTYGVEKTGQLWWKEIFEVVTHFQNLFYGLFDSWLIKPEGKIS